MIIIKDNILEEKEQTIFNCFGSKRLVLESEFIRCEPWSLIGLNNLANTPINLLNLIFSLTPEFIKPKGTPIDWHSFLPWSKLQMGQATLFLFWVGCRFVGRWQGANEELMFLQLAKCQLRMGGLEHLSALALDIEGRGWRITSSRLNNLTHTGFCVPFLKQGAISG